VTEELEIVEHGQRRRVAFDGDRLEIGDGDGAIRVVRIRGGVRVEPARPGATLSVDGEELFCKDLRTGERADVDGMQLRWLGGGEVAAAAPTPAPREPGGSALARKARLRAKSSSSLVPALAIAAVVVAVGFLVLNRLSDSTWPQTPQHYVDLARAQLENHRPERALASLAFALREATGETREAALALERDIKRRMVEQSRAQEAIAAREEAQSLLAFERRYLATPSRPAARECVRLCDAWLADYRELCGWHPDAKDLLPNIEQLRDRHAATAAPGTPDEAEDVVFAAEALLRFRWRQYRAAMERLDAFLATHPGDALVTATRARLVEEGGDWFRQCLRDVDTMLARKDVSGARRALHNLEHFSLLPAWQQSFDAKQRQVEAAGG